VGNVGPCLAICNGERKDGISPLDVTPAPCLDVTPLCHIKGWKCVRTDANPSARTHLCGDRRVRVDAPMSADFYFIFKTKFKIKLKKKLTLQHGTNSKEK
jgi:hypothetical protein